MVLIDLSNSVAGIQFSPVLVILLGFDSHVIYSGHLLTAERSINLRDNIYSTYCIRHSVPAFRDFAI